jgi:2-polyprenyl-3-methyl-5-hydroxy-6-metoxy-1,4-benzoquinol methylase
MFYPVDYGPYHGGIYTGARVGSYTRPLGLRWTKRVLLFLSPLLNRMSKIFYRDPLRQHEEKFYSSDVPLRVLDFGCGSAQYLDEARAMGWETVGMDFSTQSIETIRASNHKGIIYADESAWDQINDGYFDRIRVNHVIEHLYEPVSVLTNLRKKLKAGGAMHIATPNAESLAAAVLRKFWRGLECPRHITIYSRSALRIVLQKAGFTDVLLVQQVLSKDIARSIGAWEFEHGWLDHSEIEQKAMEKDLERILYPAMILTSRFNMSDRIHAFAIK